MFGLIKNICKRFMKSVPEPEIEITNRSATYVYKIVPFPDTFYVYRALRVSFDTYMKDKDNYPPPTWYLLKTHYSLNEAKKYISGCMNREIKIAEENERVKEFKKHNPDIIYH